MCHLSAVGKHEDNEYIPVWLPIQWHSNQWPKYIYQLYTADAVMLYTVYTVPMYIVSLYMYTVLLYSVHSVTMYTVITVHYIQDWCSVTLCGDSVFAVQSITMQCQYSVTNLNKLYSIHSVIICTCIECNYTVYTYNVNIQCIHCQYKIYTVSLYGVIMQCHYVVYTFSLYSVATQCTQCECLTTYTCTWYHYTAAVYWHSATTEVTYVPCHYTECTLYDYKVYIHTYTVHISHVMAYTLSLFSVHSIIMHCYTVLLYTVSLYIKCTQCTHCH